MNTVFSSKFKITAILFLLFFYSQALGLPNHPRLMFKATDIAPIQTKIATGYSSNLYSKIKQMADGFILSYSTTNDLEYCKGVASAFCYKIESSPSLQYKSDAIQFVKDISSRTFTTHESSMWHNWHGGAASAYIFDFLYDDLTTTEKSDLVVCLNDFLLRLKSIKHAYTVNGNDLYFEEPTLSFGNNHNVKRWYTIAILALALDGESVDDGTGNIVVYNSSADVEIAFEYISMFMKQLAGDGAYYEGDHYSTYSLPSFILLADALKINRTDLDLYTILPDFSGTTPILNRIPEWVMGDLSISRNTSPSVDIGLNTPGSINNMNNGFDHHYYLASIADVYSSEKAIFCYHKRTDYTKLNANSRDNSFINALVHYNNSWDPTSYVPPSPYSFLAIQRGVYYYKSEWQSSSLQFAFEWRNGLNPFNTSILNWKHDYKQRGIFLISYGGTDFITFNNQEFPLPLETGYNSLLYSYSNPKNIYFGQALRAELSSTADKRSNSIVNSTSIFNIDLTRAYNTLFQQIHDGNGSYETIDLSSCSTNFVPTCNSLRTVLYYDKLFGFIKEEGTIPSYFLNYDRVRKDDSLRNYLLQFYTDATSGVLYPIQNGQQVSILNNTFNIQKGNYSMEIYNLNQSTPLLIKLFNSVSNSRVLTKRLQIIDVDKIEGTIPLLLILRNSTIHQTPTVLKKEVNDPVFGNYLLGRIGWQNTDDIYTLSNADKSINDVIASHVPGNGYGLKGKVKYGWLRANKSDGKITSYALSEGTTLQYHSPFMPTTIGLAFQGVGTFEHKNTTVAWDGTNIDMECHRTDGTTPTSQEFLLYAPTLTQMKLNSSAISVDRVGDYIYRSHPSWDLISPHYGTTGTRTVTVDANQDGSPDFLTYTTWGNLLIDYGPQYGWWDANYQYQTDEPTGQDFKFFVGYFSIDPIFNTPRLGVAVMNNGVLKIDHPFNQWNNNWDFSVNNFPTIGSAIADDFNNDGLDDIAVKTWNGTVNVHNSINGTFNVIPNQMIDIPTPGMPYTPMVGWLYKGDFDGDQLPDVCIYTGAGFYIDKSSNGYFTSSMIPLLWDISGVFNGYPEPMTERHIAIADYNADGKDDFGFISSELNDNDGIGGEWHVALTGPNQLFSQWIVDPEWSEHDLPLPAKYSYPPQFPAVNGLKPGAKYNSGIGTIRISYMTPPPMTTSDGENPIPTKPLIVGDKSSTSRIKVFPNPAKNNVTFDFENAKPGISYVKIYDLLGKVVFKENINITTSSHILSWDASSINNGSYIYQIINDDAIQTGTVSILH